MPQTDRAIKFRHIQLLRTLVTSLYRCHLAQNHFLHVEATKPHDSGQCSSAGDKNAAAAPGGSWYLRCMTLAIVMVKDEGHLLLMHCDLC